MDNRKSEQYSEIEIDEMHRKLKGEILKEFEKICPTETSFRRVKKDVHDVFERVMKDF